MVDLEGEGVKPFGNDDQSGLAEVFFKPGDNLYEIYARSRLPDHVLHAKIAFFNYCCRIGALARASEITQQISASMAYGGGARNDALTAISPNYARGPAHPEKPSFLKRIMHRGGSKKVAGDPDEA